MYELITLFFVVLHFKLAFAQKFNQWAAQFLPMCQGETLAIDGKAIAGTIKDPQNIYQNFVSLISVFASQRGIVIACDKLENKKESEIHTVQKLLQALDIEGEIITLDALHCQKNS